MPTTRRGAWPARRGGGEGLSLYLALAGGRAGGGLAGLRVWEASRGGPRGGRAVGARRTRDGTDLLTQPLLLIPSTRPLPKHPSSSPSPNALTHPHIPFRLLSFTPYPSRLPTPIPCHPNPLHPPSHPSHTPPNRLRSRYTLTYSRNSTKSLTPPLPFPYPLRSLSLTPIHPHYQVSAGTGPRATPISPPRGTTRPNPGGEPLPRHPCGMAGGGRGGGSEGGTHPRNVRGSGEGSVAVALPGARESDDAWGRRGVPRRSPAGAEARPKTRTPSRGP